MKNQSTAKKESEPAATRTRTTFFKAPRFSSLLTTRNERMIVLSMAAMFGLVGVLTLTNSKAITPDKEAPVIKVTSPSADVNYPAGVILIMAANVTDNEDVGVVDFYIDGARVCSDDAFPFECSWTAGQTAATPNLQVRAYDLAGNTSVSDLKFKIAN